MWRREEEGQTEYIKERKKVPIKLVARFRLRAENRSSKYWRNESERKCSLCEEEEESLEHIFEKCKWKKGRKKLRK